MRNLTSVALSLTEIWRGSQDSRSRSPDPGHAPFDPILHFLLSTLRIVLRAKFSVSSFTRSGDMEGVPKLKKVGHVTLGHPLLTQFCIHCIVPLSILLRAKFGISSFVRFGDIEGVPKF